jgi:glycopeptide antibiotics resistance protein
MNYHFLQLLHMHYILVIVTITALKFVSVQRLKNLDTETAVLHQLHTTVIDTG